MTRLLGPRARPEVPGSARPDAAGRAQTCAEALGHHVAADRSADWSLADALRQRRPQTRGRIVMGQSSRTDTSWAAPQRRGGVATSQVGARIGLRRELPCRPATHVVTTVLTASARSAYTISQNNHFSHHSVRDAIDTSLRDAIITTRYGATQSSLHGPARRKNHYTARRSYHFTVGATRSGSSSNARTRAHLKVSEVRLRPELHAAAAAGVHRRSRGRLVVLGRRCGRRHSRF